MSELQAVLFDMDGTICDTEPAWMAAEHAMAAKYGAEWTEQDGLALVGFSLLRRVPTSRSGWGSTSRRPRSSTSSSTA